MVIQLSFEASETLLNIGFDIALILVLGYLFDSTPFACIDGKLEYIDIGKVGDGNIGVFNVFRHADLVAA